MAEDLRAQQAARATNNAYVVEGSLSERVSLILRARVMGSTVAQETIQEVRLLNPELAGRIWRCFGLSRPDEALVTGLVAEVKLLEAPGA